MPPFDARREPVRFSPTVAALTIAVCAAGLTMGTKAAETAAEKSAKAAVASPKTSKSGAKIEVEKAKADAAKTPKSAEAEAVKTAKAEAVKTAKSDKADAAKKGEAGKAEAKAVELAAAKADKADKGKAKAEDVKTAKADAAKVEPVKTAAAKAAPAAAKVPTYGAAQTIKVKLRRGETLEAAIRRAEASPDEAKAAAAKVEKALGKAPSAGQLFAVEIAPREGRVGAGRLMALTMQSSSFEPVSLTRGKAGELTLAARAKSKADAGEAVQVAGADKADAPDTDAKPLRAKLVTGEVRGSLYGSARKAGVHQNQIGEIVKAFAAKFDFQRDLKVGDKFTVVYDDEGKLLYAKIKAKGSYRFARGGGEVLWLDDDGKSLKSGLLRTPVDGARMSSRFGMRRHPILGYAKMHQGIDFAAASGTPIMAAGDGVVVEARRWGGYGNWLRIKHSGGYESGYAHLSRYASGLSVGDKVKQGQLVAYVGSTGASTGPHLHHEIWLNGQRVDPKGAKIPTGFALEGKELAAFKAQRATVEAALHRGDRKLASGKSKVAGLRPAKGSDTEA